MMDLTRRQFLHAVTGAAVAGAVAGSDPLLGTEPASPAPLSLDSDQPRLPIEPLIFPQPQQVLASGSDFVLDNQVAVLVPTSPSTQDLFLAHSLINELSDRFGVYLKLESGTSMTPGRPAVLMGSLENPLVSNYCSEMQLESDLRRRGTESYLLRANGSNIVVAGSDDRGAFYGLQSVRQLICTQDGQPRIRGVNIVDWPDKPFRGIYLFLPGRDNIPYFKRFVRNFMALYKYNTLMIEMNACMRLDRHPELNQGWVQFARDVDLSCRNYPPMPFHGMEQNSSHQDVADGGFLEKEEVADLAAWVAKHHIELVPVLPSFTHSYYLLTGHRDLAAVPQDKWPDIYCAANPKSYTLTFDVYDEFIEVLKPQSVHIGHDELFLPVAVSPQCSDNNIGELFGQDVNKIHHYLASRGIKTQLWGDMLLQSVRGVGMEQRKAPDGWTYNSPGGLTPEQVDRLIPKDCLIYNWFWSDEHGQEGSAIRNEATLHQMGFQQVFGNFEPDIQDYETRKKRSTLLGGAPSAWFATNEIGFGKDRMASFLGCSNILWTGHVIDAKALSARVQAMLPDIRMRLSGIDPPSRTETSIAPVDISRSFNMGESIPSLDVSLQDMLTGSLLANRVPFHLQRSNGMRAIVVATKGNQATSLPGEVTGIPVAASPTSLIFLHASARRANNRESFRLIWDQEDTADLLGWYEVVYEDGFVTTIPIRYGVNILEWDWEKRTSANDYCYCADPVALSTPGGTPISFFAYEWVNPRRGKVIREIRLKGTTGFRGGSGDFNNEWGPIVDTNAVILAALSVVSKRPADS